MKVVPMILLAGLIVGCSSPQVSETGEKKATQSGSDIVCERVKKIGSNFYEKRCRSRAEAEKERENARRMLDRKTDTTGGNDS